MNKKSTEIQNEIDATNNRLSELNEMKKGITDNLETLQSGFLYGSAALGELRTEQGGLATLESSIKVLEVKQTELETELESAQNVENVQTGIGNLKTIAEQAAAAFNEYDGLRVKLDETISKFVGDIFSKSAEFSGKQKEFRDLYSQLEGRKTGIDIDSELTRLGLPEKTRKSAVATEYVNLSPCKFGQSIAVAESLVGQEIFRQQHAIEKQGFEAQRAKTQAAQKAERQKEEADLADELEADRAQIVQYRIDNELPAFLAKELDNAVSDLQARKAEAHLNRS